MSLIQKVKELCDRLAPLGWRDLLIAATDGSLDIQQPTTDALRAELTKRLPIINRSLTGFEDFAAEGSTAIAKADPSRSLFYHALNSPLVVRDHKGRPLGAFPTLTELESVENFVFSLAALDLQEFIDTHGKQNIAVVIFTHDYRVAGQTVDGQHADLCFSRTGVARVGTNGPRYFPDWRTLWPEDEDNPHNFRVLPAKFAAWLAVKTKGKMARVSPILDNQAGQRDGEPKRTFWIPHHKLFAGPECLKGLTLDVDYKTSLFNLKIQRIHKDLKTSPLPTKFPYVIRDEQIAAITSDPVFGAGWLVPKPRPRLVEPAIINGVPLTYTVSPSRVDVFAAVEPARRGAPSYVHARTRVRNGVFEDLNDYEDVIHEMKANGPYKALHYIDFTGEGWVSGQVSQLAPFNLSMVPAYALVSAPDLFPSSGQFDVSEWARSNQVSEGFLKSLWNIPPTPLSEIRLPPNLQLPGNPFGQSDDTISAVVGMGSPVGTVPVWPAVPNVLRASSLPDHAAGVFAPGWDVSTDILAGVTHLAGYGLGSPFPEDAKLCAALSTFWPAVAPDVFRTFVTPIGNTDGTIAPLTDEEIGQTGDLPWDGIPGPRIVTEHGSAFVEFASFLNADYVQQAIQNRFSLRLTARISANEYESRMIAGCRVYSVLARLGNVAAERKKWLMLSFRHVSAGDTALQEAEAQAGIVLKGNVYSVEMCRIVPVIKPRSRPRFERMRLVDHRRFFTSSDDVTVLFKRDLDTRFGSAASEP